MRKEDILPGLGYDYFFVLTREQNGKKYSWYVGFSSKATTEQFVGHLDAPDTTVEKPIYRTLEAAQAAAAALNESYKQAGNYIYD